MLALEQGGEQAAAAGRRGLIALAVPDFSEREIVALQRTSIGGDMDRLAVREHAHELVVRHARPVADVAGVEMHEGRAGGGVETDAAALQAKPGEPDLLKRHAGNEEIHRVAEHVLAEARDAGMRRAAAQHGVGLGRAIGRDDLDRLLGVDVASDLPQDVEQMRVHRGRILAAPVAEEVVEFLQRVGVVATVALEGDGEVFAGMSVVEGEGAGVVAGGRVMHRACAGEQQEHSGCAHPQGVPHRPKAAAAWMIARHLSSCWNAQEEIPATPRSGDDELCVTSAG